MPSTRPSRGPFQGLPNRTQRGGSRHVVLVPVIIGLCSERELRGVVIMRRTSFGGRNHRRNWTLANGMTIIRSLARRGASWFEFIPRALHRLAIGELPAIGPAPA